MGASYGVDESDKPENVRVEVDMMVIVRVNYCY